jgi:hypothetical protein
VVFFGLGDTDAVHIFGGAIPNPGLHQGQTGLYLLADLDTTENYGAGPVIQGLFGGFRILMKVELPAAGNLPAILTSSFTFFRNSSRPIRYWILSKKKTAT